MANLFFFFTFQLIASFDQRQVTRAGKSGPVRHTGRHTTLHTPLHSPRLEQPFSCFSSRVPSLSVPPCPRQGLSIFVPPGPARDQTKEDGLVRVSVRSQMARENSRTTPPQQSRDAADSSRSRPPGSRRSPGDYTAITEPARAPTKALHPAAAPPPPTPIAEIAFALTGVVITSALMAAALAVFIRRRIRRRHDDPFHVHQRSMHSRLPLLGAMLRHILTRRSSRRHASSTVSAQPSTDRNLHDVTVDDTDTPAPPPDEASSSQSGRSGPSTLHADEETSSSDGPASSQLTEPPGPSSQAAIPAQRSVHDSGAHASSDAWLPCELANPYGSVNAADAKGALSRSQKLPEDSAENSPQRAVPSPGRGEGLEHGPPEPHARVHIRVLCQQLEPPQPQSPMARHPPTPQARSVTREATASSGAPCSHLATPEIVAAAIPLADADHSTQHASAPAHQRVLAGHSRISCEVLPLPAAGGDPLAQPTPLATPGEHRRHPSCQGSVVHVRMHSPRDEAFLNGETCWDSSHALAHACVLCP